MKKRFNKRGFVLVETIIVVSVLAIGLISLFSSYSLILSKMVNRSTYDNPEYIYKTYFITKIINKDENIMNMDLIDELNNTGYKEIYNKDYVDTSKNNPIYGNFNVEKIFIMKKNMKDFVMTSYNKKNNPKLLYFDGSTIDYLRSINDYSMGDSDNTYRLLIKFKNSASSTPEFANITISINVV